MGVSCLNWMLFMDWKENMVGFDKYFEVIVLFLFMV